MDSIDSGIFEKQRRYDLHQGATQVASGLNSAEVAARAGVALPLEAPRIRGGLKPPARTQLLDPRLQDAANDDRLGSIGTRNALLKPYGAKVARIDQATDDDL